MKLRGKLKITKWRIAGASGLLVSVAAAATAAVVAGTGHHALSYDTAGNGSAGPAGPAASTGATPSVTVIPASGSPTPAPSHEHHARRHHTAAVARHGSTSGHTSRRSSSGNGQADPCAHNHHCDVPPPPDVKPHYKVPKAPTRFDQLPPDAPTVTGAPATPPSSG